MPDYFVFEAVDGELYEIDVALGTLSDSIVAIADANGYPLDYNDDDAGMVPLGPVLCGGRRNPGTSLWRWPALARTPIRWVPIP